VNGFFGYAILCVKTSIYYKWDIGHVSQPYMKTTYDGRRSVVVPFSFVVNETIVYHNYIGAISFL